MGGRRTLEVPLNIVVIDDERSLADMLVRRLKSAGHQACAAYNGADGLALTNSAKTDLVLCDLHLPDMAGLDLLQQLLSQAQSAKVMMMTGAGTTALAVKALKLGAEDYLEKPFDFEELLALIQKLDQRRETNLALAKLKESGTQRTLEKLRIYLGAGMQKVYADLNLAAAQDGLTVLLLGESGSGKEHAAQLLHQLSGRFAGPFVELNCASLPETLVESELFGSEAGSYTDSKRRHIGLFESAQGGTLFLDEIGDLPLAAQAKLLKVLEDRTIRRVGSSSPIKLDLRLVAATNKDLKSEAEAGRFRSDLLFRLNTFVVRLPALRERREDIPALAQFLFDQACKAFNRRLAPLTAAQMEALSRRRWEGNVRELRNAIESGVLRAHEGRFQLPAEEANGAADAAVPAGEAPDPPFRPMKEAVEESVRALKRKMLLKALTESKGNKTAAARLLKTDHKTVLNLMKSLDVQAR